MILYRCDECGGKLVSQNNPSALFCSNKCRQKAYRKRVKDRKEAEARALAKKRRSKLNDLNAKTKHRQLQGEALQRRQFGRKKVAS